MFIAFLFAFKMSKRWKCKLKKFGTGSYGYARQGQTSGKTRHTQGTCHDSRQHEVNFDKIQRNFRVFLNNVLIFFRNSTLSEAIPIDKIAAIKAKWLAKKRSTIKVILRIIVFFTYSMFELHVAQQKSTNCHNCVIRVTTATLKAALNKLLLMLKVTQLERSSLANVSGVREPQSFKAQAR